MKTDRIQRAAFTLVEIMIVVAIIGLLATIAVPNFVKARNTAQAKACISNMRQIDSAIQQWALDSGKKDDDAIDAGEVAKFIKGNKMPVCPAGSVPYMLGARVDSNPSVTCPNENSTPPHKLSLP